MRPAHALAVAVLTLSTVGCSGQPDAARATYAASVKASESAAKPVAVGDFVGGEPLSQAQANELAGGLFANYEAGGATFEATVPYGSAATFVLNGDVDLRTHGLAGQLTTQYSDGRPAQTRPFVVLGKSFLDGGVLGLEQALAERGRPQVRWVARPMNPAGGAPIDVIIALLAGLGADQRENPLLLRQGDAAFLRSETVDGTPVNVYRFGAKAVYWIETATGRIVRVRANLAVAQGITEVRLSNHRPVTITPPLASAVVDRSEIPDLLARLEPAKG